MFDRRLSHVVAAARHGSFTAAAGRVGVTQSAITKSIAELERELGYQLFNRTLRGTMLTDEGRIFVERAARLLDDAKQLMRGSTDDHNPYSGVLRVGVCPASLELQLLEPTTLLLSRYPDIRVDISGASFERMVQQLRTGAVDVALGYEAAFAEQADFRLEPLPALETALFVRRGHPLLECSPVTPKDISAYPFVTPSDSLPYAARIRNFYEDQDIDARRQIHTVDYFPLVKRLVSRTAAVSVIVRKATHSEAFKSRFAVLDYTDPFPPAALCCAVRTRWEPRATVRAFIKACREALQPAAGSPAAGQAAADRIASSG